MKSKASLLLMEQLVMLLVFAIAAALCLGVFVRANQISEELTRRDEAVILAQNAAELLKSTGDLQQAQEHSSGDFTIVIQEEDPGITGLRQANIVIFYENSEVFALRTGWQEVRP